VVPGPGGIPVDARMAAGDARWAIGDATGTWPLTYVGKYQGRVAAANILGRPREASYDAVPRVVFCDPQAASVGAPDGPFTLAAVPRTATDTRAYLRDRLLGPAGSYVRADLPGAIRDHPRDVIRPASWNRW
jgi:hypothetical protein